MYKKLIENYVNKLTHDDIKKIAYMQNINITSDDVNTIYFYIKNYWLAIYEGNPNLIFNELKEKIEPNTYLKIIELYNQYKNRI